MAALHRQRSESLSRNVAWGKRQSFRNGNVPFHFSRILGYEKGADGNPKIVPEQAEIVKRIFQSYLVGSSTTQIKAELEAEGIPSPSGKNIWSVASIKQILRNEKYKGDALLQKTYVSNFLNKKSVKNNGELPQYYVSDHHEAIIPEDIFNRVQEEIARRNCKPKSAMKIAKTENGKYSGKYALSELLFCGRCGTPYRRVTWARNGKKRIVWRCISRLEHGTEYCKDSPTIEESRLHEAIMKAIQSLIEDEKELKENVWESLKDALSGATNEFSLREAENQLSALKDKLAGLAEAGVEADGDIETYSVQFKETLGEIETLENSIQIHKLKSSIDQNADPRFKEIMNLLNGDEIKIGEYDDVLVRQAIRKIKVMPADRLQITFKCGTELEQAL